MFMCIRNCQAVFHSGAYLISHQCVGVLVAVHSSYPDFTLAEIENSSRYLVVSHCGLNLCFLDTNDVETISWAYCPVVYLLF